MSPFNKQYDFIIHKKRASKQTARHRLPHELSNNRPRHNPLSPYPSQTPLSRPSKSLHTDSPQPNPAASQQHRTHQLPNSILSFNRANKELINPRPKHHRPSSTHTTLSVPCFNRFQPLPHKIHSPHYSTKKRASPKGHPQECRSNDHQQLIVSDEPPRTHQSQTTPTHQA